VKKKLGPRKGSKIRVGETVAEKARSQVERNLTGVFRADLTVTINFGREGSLVEHAPQKERDRTGGSQEAEINWFPH